MGTINAKSDSKNAKMAEKSTDMSQYLNLISLEMNLDKKKILAIEMAEHFTVGGKENFIESITNTKSVNDVDRIAFNAVLKGEGLSSKRF